ncbi:MAG: polyisoprenoid-binding protein [Sulfurospirillum sp.]|nr:polyisoprenoid-binding protein [Sulfurospirillum sp.]
MKKILLIVLFLSSAVFASTYEVDMAHSKVGFKVKHMMISNVYGSFANYDATIDYDENSKKFKTLDANIEVSSINTENTDRDKHLKSAEFFDTEKFPTIGFKLLSIDKNKAIGELSIKKITKKVTFDFQNNGTVKDPWGNTRLGFSLETKINRKEFGLTSNKLLETGGLVVGDEVAITVDIEAKKKKKQ